MKREVLKAAAILFAIVALSFLLGFVTARMSRTDVQERIERDTTIYVDTIAYYKPVPKDSIVLKYVTRTLPVSRPNTGAMQKTDTFLAGNYAQNNGENIPPQELSDERDSVAVEIPITQKRYDGEDYSAYVSGYEPQLDSIFVFPKTIKIRERIYKPPNKFHIGITGGFGYSIKSKQAEPFIGIGLTYSLISF